MKTFSDCMYISETKTSHTLNNWFTVCVLLALKVNEKVKKINVKTNIINMKPVTIKRDYNNQRVVLLFLFVSRVIKFTRC